MEFDEFLSGYKPTTPLAPPPTQKTFFITSDNSHCIVLNELGSHEGCHRVFLGCLEQIFPYELSRLAKSAASNIFSYFV